MNHTLVHSPRGAPRIHQGFNNHEPRTRQHGHKNLAKLLEVTFREQKVRSQSNSRVIVKQVGSLTNQRDPIGVAISLTGAKRLEDPGLHTIGLSTGVAGVPPEQLLRYGSFTLIEGCAESRSVPAGGSGCDKVVVLER